MGLEARCGVYDFSGWHEHTLDEKGRLSLPSAFRDKLGVNKDDRVYATCSLSGPCIEVYPDSEWQKLLEKVSRLPQTHPQVIAFRRRFISAASELTMDRAGRVLIPPPLRVQCGLAKDVLVAGNIEKMEVWDRATFLALNEGSDGLAILRSMADLGF